MSAPDVRNSLWQAAIKASSGSSQKKWFRCLVKRAAVAIILREEVGELEILMIQRAEHEKDRWSGQMGFPGGKQDLGDLSIQVTAERELFEELSIGSNDLALLGRLSDINARSHKPMQQAMVITPFLFASSGALEPVKNEEVADVLWVPLSLFNEKNRQLMRRFGRDLPCYYYQGKCIWGLSLMMIDELNAFRLNR